MADAQSWVLTTEAEKHVCCWILVRVQLGDRTGGKAATLAQSPSRKKGREAGVGTSENLCLWGSIQETSYLQHRSMVHPGDRAELKWDSESNGHQVWGQVRLIRALGSLLLQFSTCHFPWHGSCCRPSVIIPVLTLQALYDLEISWILSFCWP